jgi:hypothetical protein
LSVGGSAGEPSPCSRLKAKAPIRSPLVLDWDRNGRIEPIARSGSVASASRSTGTTRTPLASTG